MTNPNHSHITLLVDRSGSMSSMRDEAENAINHFITEQRAAEGTATLTLVDFDSEDPARILYSGDINDAPKYALTPRAMTPLHDALGRAINETGKTLAAMEEPKRPGRVFFVVVTDGWENASHEYTTEAITQLIKEQEETYSWEFIFLASGPDAWSQSQAYQGTQMVNNSVKAAPGATAYLATMAYASSNIAARRAGGQSVNYGGTVDEEGNVTSNG